MKYLLHLTLGLLFITACSPGKGDSNELVQDSLAAVNTSEDSTIYTDIEASESPDTDPLQEGCKMYKADTSSLSGIIQELIQDVDYSKNDYYILYTKAEGYEYGSEGSWYFDSEFNLRYFVEDWASEGQSGTNQYVFCDGKLHAFHENTSYDGSVQDIVEAYNMIGIVYTQDEAASINSPKKLLDAETIVSKQVEIVQRLHELLNMLEKDGKIDGSEIIVSEEKEVSYGQDFTVTEKFTCTIDTAVFRVIYK